MLYGLYLYSRSYHECHLVLIVFKCSNGHMTHNLYIRPNVRSYYERKNNKGLHLGGIRLLEKFVIQAHTKAQMGNLSWPGPLPKLGLSVQADRVRKCLIRPDPLLARSRAWRVTRMGLSRRARTDMSKLDQTLLGLGPSEQLCEDRQEQA